MDKDGNGEITKEELSVGYSENEHFREALTYMDISEEDLEILWTILDADKSGTISYGEFVTSCYKLKSSNTHFMLAYIKYYITVIKDKICREITIVKDEIVKEEQKLEAEMVTEERHFIEEVGMVVRMEDTIGAELNTNAALQPAITGSIDKTDIIEEDYTDFIERLSSDIKRFVDGVKQSSKSAPKTHATPKDQSGDEECKDLSNQPVNELGVKENRIYLDLLQTSDRRQRELMTSIEEIRQQLGMGTMDATTAAPQQRWDLPFLAPAERTVPSERSSSLWPLSSGCCDKGTNVNVVTLRAVPNR
jgi:hypothetical protein